MLFTGPNCFRDLPESGFDYPSHANARRLVPVKATGLLDKNPLFQDGDLLYNGIIIREIPEMDVRLPITYQTAGSGSIQIAPVFMCG